MDSIELLLCTLLVLFSAFFSSSEVALFSLSRFQLRELKENFQGAHRVIKKLLGDPSGMLITILVTNEIINISLSTLIAESVFKNWSAKNHWLITALDWILPLQWLSKIPAWVIQTLASTLITTPIILIFCEVTPKIIGVRANQIIALVFSRPLLWIYQFYKPIRFLVTYFVKSTTALLKTPQPENSLEKKGDPLLKHEDFLLILEKGHKEGMIHESEMDLIKNVFEFDETTVDEIYTPILKVFSCSINTKTSEALDLLVTIPFSRIPIYEKNRFDIVGVLYAKDLIQAKLNSVNLDSPIGPLVNKPFFVQSSMQLNTLFRKMKERKTHMAVVTDSKDNVIGVVTMHDLLDEIFDDLFPNKKEVTH